MNPIKQNTPATPSVNTLLKSFLSDEFFNWPAKTQNINRGSFPPVNIIETNEHFTIDVAAPGLKKEDFTIELEDNRLTVATPKQNPSKPEQAMYVVREFGFTHFKRTFILPENNIDEESIKASYHNGILSIQLPKREEEKARAVKKVEVL